MFGSTFAFGFSIGDVVTQITGLLGNPLVLGLVTASIAVGWALRLVYFVRSTAGKTGSPDDASMSRAARRSLHFDRANYRRLKKQGGTGDFSDYRNIHG